MEQPVVASADEKKAVDPEVSSSSRGDGADDGLINASGHHQELERNFSLVSMCSYAITAGNTWVSLGGTITVAIYNGGPPGVIYEFIAVSVFYWLIAASIAELASAMPTAAGVYHWASVTAGRYGRVVGFFAGWWNFLGWLFALAAVCQIVGAQTVSMYAAFNPGFEQKQWHVFVSFLAITWVSCAIVLFANRILPFVESLGGFFTLVGVFITIIVCASMPAVNGRGHASNDFVWRQWVNSTGYSSNGFVFLLGMLNGAFAVGTPDITSHLAEEIPKPSMNIPKAILAQFIIGFFTTLCYVITIFYGIYDLDLVLDEGSRYFPLAAIYRQATGSAGGALGLIILSFLPLFIACIGLYLTASRTFWTLARDKATPFSTFFSRVSPKHRNPANAILFCAVLSTVLGCIYVGSTTAFSAFVGSFVVLTTLSYLAAILPHLLSRRANVTPGWFWMPAPIGYAVSAVASVYIAVFIVIFCFPFGLPITPADMNYSSLITGGLTLFVAAFWFWRRKTYVGPKQVRLADNSMFAKDAI
ncbi:MAG: hypothetical protein M1815_004977 [Lichina confinis]|nr:MAG: hypothetical protein M1815_004977 [Lichina confinis]